VPTPVILATWEAEIRRIMVKASPGKQFLRPQLQNNRAKWAGSVAQVPPKKKKKKKEV
jgi:hypothetical protein